MKGIISLENNLSYKLSFHYIYVSIENMKGS